MKTRIKKYKIFYFSVAILLLLAFKLYTLLFPPFLTQTVIYRNKHNNKVTVEFQMQDMGAFGYNRRTVIVEPGILFNTIKPVNIDNIDKNEWLFVDEEVNEQHIIYP